jgi:ribosome modulation factor
MTKPKRHKRDRTTRAYSRGYQAGLFGRSREQCPHQALAARESWLEGWVAGHRDHSDGTLAASGLHKRPL